MTEGSAHKLLVLGSMDEFVELVDRARDRGYFVIVCDGYADGPAKAHADATYDIDVRDTATIAQICIDEGVDGIVTSFSDLLAECMSKIAEQAELPRYLEPAKIRYLREKPLMKQMMAKLGIPTARTVEVRKNSIAEDVTGIGFPLVVKPVNGYGSRGVYILDNVEQIAERFDEIASYSSFDYILAEEYYQGFEMNMMNWVLDGEPVVLSIADREKTFEIPHAVPHVSRIVYPSVFTDVVLDEARDILRKVARFLDMDCGPLCMQFFYSPADGIKVCEIAGRIFGYEHELLEYASGFSIEDLLLNYAYDREALARQLREHSLSFPQVSAGLYFHGYEGEVGSLEGVAEARELDGVEEVLAYYAPGDVIGHGVGAKPYVIRCYLRAGTREKVDEFSAALFESMRVRDAKGSDMLYRSELTDYAGALPA